MPPTNTDLIDRLIAKADAQRAALRLADAGNPHPLAQRFADDLAREQAHTAEWQQALGEGRN
jgi:hypothetical protein